MQIYWQSVFLWPSAIIKEIEVLMRRFLWCQGSMKKGKARVKWDDVCLQKEEGGLGIRRLKYWNIALITTHIWRILAHKKSIWAMWRWLPDWVDRYAILNNLAPPVLSVNSDMVLWKDIASNKCVFSISHVWEFLRPHAPTVQWYSMVWFSQCIPRHAFVVWSLVLNHIDFPMVTHGWKDFVLLVSPFAVRNVARIVVIKLLFAASIYYVWQERNRCLFKKGNRSAVQLYETIYSTSFGSCCFYFKVWLFVRL
ncbi:uncharacterized protein [Rutidosis leptorrhynchoides]|uniref:uncharacterized protein n=1 Tax=Rutidosis leptorrhynchoides TaxID=125765 RepID=UPI003A99B03B